MNEAGHEAREQQAEGEAEVGATNRVEADAAPGRSETEVDAGVVEAEAGADPTAAGASATGQAGAADAVKATAAPKLTTGEVRRQLDRPPSDRYREAEAEAAGARTSTRTKRLGAAAGVAAATMIVTFLLISFDIGPGLLVIGVAGGWLTGLAAAGGAPAGKGEGAGTNRAATTAVLAEAAIALGLLLDSLRAYALGGVLLPWEYQLARFGIVAPLAIVLAGAAGWLRGR